jgi:hypothetical protein
MVNYPLRSRGREVLEQADEIYPTIEPRQRLDALIWHPPATSISALNGSTGLHNHRRPPPGSRPRMSRGAALMSILALSLGLWGIVGTVVSLLL